MNFAPYQSSPPESTRALSPPLRSPTASPKPGANNLRPGNANRHISSVADNNDPWAAARGAPLPSPSQFADRGYDDLESGQNERSYFVNSGGNNGGAGVGLGVNAEGGGGGRGTDVFETSLGIRMEIEACLPYLLLPPAGGVALLLFEHKSDYVRYVFPSIFGRLGGGDNWDCMNAYLCAKGFTHGNRRSSSRPSSLSTSSSHGRQCSAGSCLSEILYLLRGLSFMRTETVSLSISLPTVILLLQC